MGKTKFYIFLILCCFPVFKTLGQSSEQKVHISEVLEQITKAHSVAFNYESSLLEGITVFQVSENLSLSAKIKNLEGQTNLVFEKVSDLVYTISKLIQLCGYIIDSESEQPLKDATITGKSAYAISDENGYFEIELKSESEQLTIRYIGFKTIERQAKYFDTEDC